MNSMSQVQAFKTWLEKLSESDRLEVLAYAASKHSSLKEGLSLGPAPVLKTKTGGLDLGPAPSARVCPTCGR